MKFEYNSTVELIKSNANDKDVAHAAWVSNFGTGSKVRNTERIGPLVDFLYKNRHMSPFEHGSFTFFIDTPIFVAREFMRHRTWSYNETSGRYKELEPRFYIPTAGRPLIQQGKPGEYSFTSGEGYQHESVHNETQRAYMAAWDGYQNMLNRGVAREVARNVLPVGTMTQFYATANPRNVMQFLDLRNENQALYEIREVAVKIEEIFAEQMPITYEAYKKFDWRKQ